MQSRFDIYDRTEEPTQDPDSTRGFWKSPMSVTSRRPSASMHRSSSAEVWNAIRSLPGVRGNPLINDAVFLLTTLPVGIAAFMLVVIGLSFGVTLSILFVGLVILIWVVGSLLRLAGYERERLNAFLGLELQPPTYTNDQGANVFAHLIHIRRSARIRKDLLYLLLLFPIGILELALVLAPWQFLVASAGYFFVGDINVIDAFGFEVTSFAAAVSSLLAGLVSLVPISILIIVVAALHRRLAIRLLR